MTAFFGDSLPALAERMNEVGHWPLGLLAAATMALTLICIISLARRALICPKTSRGKVVPVLGLAFLFPGYLACVFVVHISILGADSRHYSVKAPTLILTAIHIGLESLSRDALVPLAALRHPPSWPEECRKVAAAQGSLDFMRQMFQEEASRLQQQAQEEMAQKGDRIPSRFNSSDAFGAYKTRVFKRATELARGELSDPQGLAKLCARYAAVSR